MTATEIEPGERPFSRKGGKKSATLVEAGHDRH